MLYRRLSIGVSRSMNVLTSAVNAVSGQSEWVVQGDDYDHVQEIARSSFADMLHDTQRNELYEEALKRVLSSSSRPMRVLDIGTGTGLLSLMAARHGAHSVAACETFRPMAAIAKRIIDLNGFSDKIEVISKRSTDMNPDEIVRADVCVAEVFDTELIGEGALRTFYDAHKDLLKPGARVIPSRAKVFVQPVESRSACAWFRPVPVNIGQYNVHIKPAHHCQMCPGTSAVHDIQLTHFNKSNFEPVCDPILIYEFDFEATDIKFDEEKGFEVCKAEWSRARTVDALFFWWELDMDGTGQLILSTKPSRNSQWRDHWMQAVYGLPKSLDLRENASFRLFAAHDEYSFWFHTFRTQEDCHLDRPFCDCGLHTIHSRISLSRFNDIKRYDKWTQALVHYRNQNPGGVVLCYSDCSLLPIIAGQLGMKVVTIETNKHASGVVDGYIRENKLQNCISIHSNMDKITLNSAKVPVSLIIGDPFYFSSLLPWHNLHFWYFVKDHCSAIPNTATIPKGAELWCVPMCFDNLHKIRAPVGTVQGFDLSPFDQLAQKSMLACDAAVEPQPLWEYPGVCVAEPVKLISWNAPKAPLLDTKNDVQIHLCRPANGVAFWMKWWLTDEIYISTGVEDGLSAGDIPIWDYNSTQGVMFLKHNNEKTMQMCASFSAATAHVQISSDLQYSSDKPL